MLKSTKLRVNTSKKNQNLIELLTKNGKISLKTIKAKEAFDLDQTTSSNHLLPTPKVLRFSSSISIYSFIQRSLYLKHNSTPIECDLIELENIIQSKYCRVLAVFKEKLMFNFGEEFLKRYYKKSESRPRILKCVDYYKNYLTFFCKPIFSELNLNDILQYHGEKKAKIYYSNNFKDNNKHYNSDSNRDRKKESDKRNDNTIFTTTLKGNISMNSCLSVSHSVYNIDYNHVDTKPLIQNPSNFINKSTINAMNEIIDEMTPHINSNWNNNANANTIDNDRETKIKVNQDLNLKKPQLKKMYLMQKTKNQIVSIDKTHSIKGQNMLSINRIISPQGKKKEKIADYICITESSKKPSRNKPLNAHKENEMLYLYNQTEVTSNKKPHLKNATSITNEKKLVNKIKLKGNYNIIHCKNSFSTQMTLSVRDNKDIKMKKLINNQKTSIDYSNGKKMKYTLKVKPAESNEKPSRNVKCDLEKGYYTLENTHRKSAKKNNDEEVKLPLFKTINVKRKETPSNHKQNNYIIQKKE